MIFLFGTQKSGTTWLRNIISEFVSLSVNYEWQVPKLVNAMYDHVSFCGVKRSRIETRKITLAASSVAIAELIKSEGDDVFADKSAYPSLAVSSRNDELYPYHISLVKLLFPNSINVQIVRDPRDVLVSSKHYFNLGTITEKEIIDFANSWSKCNIRWAEDEPSHIIRYEDLKNNFENEIEILLDVLDISYDPDSFSRLVEKFGTIRLSNKKDPFFYRSGKIGDWKMELSQLEATTLINHCALAMEMFGYE